MCLPHPAFSTVRRGPLCPAAPSAPLRAPYPCRHTVQELLCQPNSVHLDFEGDGDFTAVTQAIADELIKGTGRLERGRGQSQAGP